MCKGKRSFKVPGSTFKATNAEFGYFEPATLNLELRSSEHPEARN